MNHLMSNMVLRDASASKKYKQHLNTETMELPPISFIAYEFHPIVVNVTTKE